MIMTSYPKNITKINLTYWFEHNLPLYNKDNRGGVRKLIHGVGVNDANYSVAVRIRKEHNMCPVYSEWKSMLSRAYSHNRHKVQPTYEDITVCDEWLSFSNFRVWYIDNYKEGYQLDKDLLIFGNKKYSPETCVFVPQWLNSFTLGRDKSRGKYKIGVYWNKRANKFQSACSNPKTKKRDHLGYFNDENQAHLAWIMRKLELALELKPEMDEIDSRIYYTVIRIIKEKGEN